MRRRARIDANQGDIVNAFRRMGCTVHPTHMIGQGFPDIVVGVAGANLLVEIKDGRKVPSKRKLTPDEKAWHDRWRGTVHIVESGADVEELVNKTRRG